MSKSQIDRLGDRLKSGSASEADLKMLAEYRASFADPFTQVVNLIMNELGMVPTARAAKTTESIVAKLQREKTSLSSMQDMAGCRLLVEDIAAQDRAIEGLLRVFPGAREYDRRLKPSHGYRAVHLIVRNNEQRVEIQIRTKLQQIWA